MAIQSTPDTLTPREHEQMQYEERMFDKNAAYNLEMAKLDAKWAALLRIPMTIIKLPVYCLLAIGIIIAVARGKKLPEELWKLIR